MSSPARGRLPDLPAVDGLRALAVAAVCIYHAGLGWLPGGFLGVEVFFVISGYLITSLLLAEYDATGRIDLKAFWTGRARRLLPALLTVLISTLLYALVFLPEEVAGLRVEALAALGYVTNWYLIFADQSYFEALGRPSLLKHLWSLAIEEQFYLLWPLILALLLSVWGATRRGYRSLGLVVAVGAAASTLLMVSLYEPGSDPSRLYYGTDTRATSLLVGAVLAFVCRPRPDGAVEPVLTAPKATDRCPSAGAFAGAVGAEAAALVGLGTLAVACVLVSEDGSFLYQGGFLIVSVATAALIGCCVATLKSHGGLVTSILSVSPLRWLGLRSYGIYLWHWPVYMVSRPGVDIPLGGLAALALRLSITLALAELSYRLVETPIRRGALGRAWKALREGEGARRRRLRTRWMAAFGSGAALVSALTLATATVSPPEKPDYLAKDSVQIETGSPGSVSESQDERQGARADTAPEGRVGAVGSLADTADPLPRSRLALASSTEADTGADHAGDGSHAPEGSPERLAAGGVPDGSDGSTGAPSPNGTEPEKDASQPEQLHSPGGETPPPAESATDGPEDSSAPRAGSKAAAAEPEPAQTPRQRGDSFPQAVTVVGDSVMVGAAEEVQARLSASGAGVVTIDARQGMQTAGAVAVLEDRARSGELGEVVVVHIGTNGTFAEEDIAAIMDATSRAGSEVVFVNNKVPRQWEAQNNMAIEAAGQRYSRATVADWHSESENEQELFYPDGIHLRPEGAAFYADLIASNAERAWEGRR